MTFDEQWPSNWPKQNNKRIWKFKITTHSTFKHSPQFCTTHISFRTHSLFSLMQNIPLSYMLYFSSMQNFSYIYYLTVYTHLYTILSPTNTVVLSLSLIFSFTYCICSHTLWSCFTNNTNISHTDQCSPIYSNRGLEEYDCMWGRV